MDKLILPISGFPFGLRFQQTVSKDNLIIFITSFFFISNFKHQIAVAILIDIQKPLREESKETPNPPLATLLSLIRNKERNVRIVFTTL